MRMIKILSTALLSFAFIGASAQTYTVVTADQAVQALLGPGVTYSNAQFTGVDYQLGTVTGGVAPMEVTSGIVLCTDSIGLNVPGTLDVALGSGIANFPDLLEVANSVPDLINQTFDVVRIYDLAVLEFDFVATGDLLTFDYIFASFEYLQWENSEFNDVFAFFLSGPGIVGPYASPAGFPDGAVNLAVVPGSNPALPITISSVNGQINSDFFVANPSQQGINVRGVTTLLTVSSELICGATYHIAMAIADGSDQTLHSTVILKEGSFNVFGDLITPITDDANGLFPEVTIVEGCIPGQFVILPIPCLTEPLTIDLNYSGTAIIGDDYITNFQTTLTMEPDIDEYIVEITPLDDDLDEGPESITLSFTYTDYSGAQQLETATVFMQDYDVNQPFISDIPSSFICPDEVVTITPVPNQGYPPYTYTWSTGATGPQQSFTGGSEGTYEVTLTDLCDYTWTEVFQIFEPDTFRTDTFDICLGDIGVLALGGLAPYEFNFNTAGIVAEEDNSTYRGLIFGSTLFTVTDGCGQVRAGALNVITCQIPNVFTPNGDGKNEFFEIQGINAYPNSKLQVWNRWGVLVYESENYENFWSAEEQPDGTYFYLLQRSDGEIVTGEITILR